MTQNAKTRQSFLVRLPDGETITTKSVRALTHYVIFDQGPESKTFGSDRYGFEVYTSEAKAAKEAALCAYGRITTVHAF